MSGIRVPEILLPASVLIASQLIGGCGSSTGDVLVGNPDNAIKIENLDASRAVTWVYGSFPICVRKGAGNPVRLDHVELRNVDGIELVAAGIKVLRTGDDGVAAWPGPLPSDYEPVEDQDFDVACNEPDSRPEIALEVRRTGSGSGRMSGFAVVYTAEDGQRSLRYDAQITLCVDDTYAVCVE